MKPLLTALALVVALAGCGRQAPVAPAAKAWCDGRMQARGAERPATHGMLIVGTRHVYLSHLPMFGSPHDYQVILEADLGEARGRYLTERARSGEKVYTLVPEPFVLSELARGKTSFKADVVRGHFERGGETIAEGVTVRIKQVLHFRRFDRAAAHPRRAEALLFGTRDEAFLAHRIAARPDFDQVVGAQSDALGSKPTLEPLVLPLHPARTPFRPGTVVEAQGTSPVAVGDELYHETGDLS